MSEEKARQVVELIDEMISEKVYNATHDPGESCCGYVPDAKTKLIELLTEK